MPKNLLDSLPEIFVSTSAQTGMVSRLSKKGQLRKIAPKVYTKNLREAPEAVVRRNLWPLVCKLVPGALIADRTAIEMAPAIDGSIFVIAERKRDISLPGITIKSRKGHAPLATDRPFIDGLYLSSQARAYLENMAPSRRRSGDVSRTLNKKEVEERLERILRQSGEAGINRLRDEAREIADALGMKTEFAALDRIIGALQGTKDANLVTPAGIARREGHPYDTERLKLFEALHRELRDWIPNLCLAPQREGGALATLAFFEAYFSNFIEGTEFEVSEAADIVFRGVIPSERPKDAHDILGTWQIVSDIAEMRRTPSNAASLISLLKSRHATIMAARPEKGPGQFKGTGNKAGSTVFVAPELVEGTLQKGFEIYRSLSSPYGRAVFMMFLVSEVHPFADGNGRVARIMMNAELIASGEERIIIPTVYRNNYIASLKALSHNQHAEPLIRTLDYAQKWTSALPWGDLEKTHQILAECNAFHDPTEADHSGIRLKIPSGTP
jgi:hypothetical protein